MYQETCAFFFIKINFTMMVGSHFSNSEGLQKKKKMSKKRDMRMNDHFTHKVVPLTIDIILPLFPLHFL